MITQTFSVPTMHCPSCVMLLEGIEDEVEGITSVKGDFKKQKIEVEYDETKLSQEQIIAAAKKEGYEITPVAVV
jgi:copper chaperone